MTLTSEQLDLLYAPLPDVDFLPRTPKNGRAMAVAYANSRDCAARLDVVFGPLGWSFTCVSLSDKVVQGSLTIGDCTKSDFGEADKEDETYKAACSDAFKRCAAQLGIGRYLYHLPKLWCDYDEQRRCFKTTPQHKPADIATAVRQARGVLPATPKPVLTSQAPVAAEKSPEPAESTSAPEPTQTAPAASQSPARGEVAARTKAGALLTEHYGADRARHAAVIADILKREVTAQSKPTAAEWAKVAGVLATFAAQKKATFALWNEVCKTNAYNAQDRSFRISIWNGLLDTSFESSDEFLPSHWEKLRAEIKNGAVSDPFAGE